jgi:hypothetical protein
MYVVEAECVDKVSVTVSGRGERGSNRSKRSIEGCCIEREPLTAKDVVNYSRKTEGIVPSAWNYALYMHVRLAQMAMIFITIAISDEQL